MPKLSFPHKYLNYNEMISDLDLLCKQFPKNVEIEKINLIKTLENRSIVALRVYPKGKKFKQPTVWMDANMHSAELIGTNTVLAHIQQLTEKLTNKEDKFFQVNYVFIPRVCPDGAEQYFTSGKKNRSNARDLRNQSELGCYWQRMCLVEKDVKLNTYELLQQKNRIG